MNFRFEWGASVREMTAHAREDAGIYLRADSFLKTLKNNREWLTQQQYKTLRGQALSGDLQGAMKGFEKLIGKQHRA